MAKRVNRKKWNWIATNLIGSTEPCGCYSICMRRKGPCALSLSEGMYLCNPFIEPNTIFLCISPPYLTLPYAQSISSLFLLSALMLHVVLFHENLFSHYFADRNIQHFLFPFTLVILQISKEFVPSIISNLRYPPIHHPFILVFTPLPTLHYF